MDVLNTFHILLTTIGKKSIFRMIYSLKSQLNKNDFLTIVYDAKDIDNTYDILKEELHSFKCKTNLIMEETNLGYWGHGIRNKYKKIINEGDFILHADDDDIYKENALKICREKCVDKECLYFFRFQRGHEIFWLTKEPVMNNIGTPCGVIPLQMNKKGRWGDFYGGDGYFYQDIIKQMDGNDKYQFVDFIFYVVNPGYTKINVEQIFILNVKDNCKNNFNFGNKITVLEDNTSDVQHKRAVLNWKAWKTISDSKIQNALIIENTSFLHQNFENVINQSIEDANKCGKWTIIYLHSMDKEKERKHIIESNYLCNVNNEGNDICAYLVTLNCVENIFLKNFPKPENSLSAMINWGSCDWIEESKGYIVHPFIAEPKPHFFFESRNISEHVFEDFKDSKDYIENEFLKLSNRIFIISLKRNVERRNHITEQCNKIGLTNYEFFDAFDGIDINVKKLQEDGVLASDEELNHNLYKDGKHFRGTIGCALSHWYCWKEIVKRGLEYAIVIEDNVWICNDFKRRFVRAVKRCNVVKWTIIYLHSWWDLKYSERQKGDFLPNDSENNSSNIYIGDIEGGGTKGYYITKELIEKTIFKEFPKIKEPADGMTNWGTCPWGEPSGGFVIRPMLLCCDKNQSTLQFDLNNNFKLNSVRTEIDNLKSDSEQVNNIENCSYHFCIDKWFNRFGNNLEQIIQAINVAQYHKGIVSCSLESPFFKHFQFDFRNNDNHQIKELIDEHAFFYGYKKCILKDYKKKLHIVQGFILKIIKFNIPSVSPELERLFIHMRSGDIFSQTPHPAYIQPPLVFYKQCIKNHPNQKVTIVTNFSESNLNPCIDKLLELYPFIEINENSLEKDIQMLCGAENLVIGFGFFGYAISLISQVLKNLYVTEYLYNENQDDYDISHHSSLHNLVLNNNNCQISNYYISDYIFPGKWYNSKIQRQYMLNYDPCISDVSLKHKKDSSLKYIENTYPYISVDTWLSIADEYYIESNKYCIVNKDRNKDRNKKIIFIETSLVLECIDRLLKESHNFILITATNFDFCCPYIYYPCDENKLVTKLLNHDKLIFWYSKNVCMTHPKLIPIPIGVKWQWCSNSFFGESKDEMKHIYQSLGHCPDTYFYGKVFKKDKDLYWNFSINTTGGSYYKIHLNDREKCCRFLEKYWKESPRSSFNDYLKVMSEYKFAVSPPGTGIDCYRTWEALMVGTIPIVLSSPINSLYDELPVLIVNNWNELTPKLLEKTYRNFRKKKFNFEKIYSPYWIQKIKNN